MLLLLRYTGDRLEERDAESKVLHRVKVVETSRFEDFLLSAYSFEFQDLEEMESA